MWLISFIKITMAIPKTIEKAYLKVIEAFSSTKNNIEFDAVFPIPSIFEKEFENQKENLLKHITKLANQYSELIKKRDKKVIKISEDEYILEMYNNSNRYLPVKYTKKDLKNLKIENVKAYNSYAERYNNSFQNSYEDTCVQLKEFIISETKFLYPIDKKILDYTIEDFFWQYIHSQSIYINNTDENTLLESLSKLLINFKNYYQELELYKLINCLEQNFDLNYDNSLYQIIINVGKKSSDTNRAGYTNTNYTVYNDKKEFKFSSSTKDEKSFSGPFINIFIIQTKHLIKLTFGINDVEEVEYIISKDCEKNKIINGVELLISKHHGNETIIFDTKEDAKKWQTKFTEIRDGKWNNNYKK